MKEEIKNWISKADKDLEEAKFLFSYKRPLEDVAFFIHQAIEKYLKAFLINSGWELKKIHDLVKLLKDVIKIDNSFERFLSEIEGITNYYIETRYPVGYDVEYTEEDIENSIKVAEEIKYEVIKKLEKSE